MNVTRHYIISHAISVLRAVRSGHLGIEGWMFWINIIDVISSEWLSTVLSWVSFHSVMVSLCIITAVEGYYHDIGTLSNTSYWKINFTSCLLLQNSMTGLAKRACDVSLSMALTARQQSSSISECINLNQSSINTVSTQYKIYRAADWTTYFMKMWVAHDLFAGHWELVTYIGIFAHIVKIQCMVMLLFFYYKLFLICIYYLSL